MVEYTKKYLEYLKKLEEENKEKNLRKPGAYYSPYKQNGDLRDNSMAIMYAKYG